MQRKGGKHKTQNTKQIMGHRTEHGEHHRGAANGRHSRILQQNTSCVCVRGRDGGFEDWCWRRRRGGRRGDGDVGREGGRSGGWSRGRTRSGSGSGGGSGGGRGGVLCAVGGEGAE